MNCKHGEFELGKGCPQCIAAAKEARGIVQGDNWKQVKIGLAGAGSVISEKPAETEPEPTTLVKVYPEQDSELMGYYSQAKSILEYAKTCTIDSLEAMQSVSQDLTSVRGIKKQLEGRRKEYLMPFQAHVRDIQEIFKTLVAPVDEADKLLSAKMIAFNAEQEARRVKQEAINRKRMEASQEEAALNHGEISEDVNLIPVEQGAVKTTRTALGTASMVDHWLYEITDPAKLPREYLMPDDAMLSAVAKASHDKKPVPGVRFYNKPFMSTRVGR